MMTSHKVHYFEKAIYYHLERISNIASQHFLACIANSRSDGSNAAKYFGSPSQLDYPEILSS